MPSVLFVDDEPMVLEGLKRMLRPFRKDWKSEFCGSAKEALSMLSAERFDVLVTDMRMPEMDGLELLQRVSESHPEMVRVVLSGQADEDVSLKTAGLAHQYLSKPCDWQTLQTTLERACSMGSLLTAPELKNLVSKMGTLPSLPGVYVQLMEELNAPNTSIQRVAEIMSRDMGMAAKALQLVNSAFFGLRFQVSSLQHAITVLGLKTMRALVLSVQVFSQFQSRGPQGFSAEVLMNHCLSVGSLAKMIVEKEGRRKDLTDDALLAGLLHDSGQLILADRMASQYVEVMRVAKAKGITLWEAERETFGATHAQVGAYLMGLWGLPQAITEAILFHHNPMDCPNRKFSTLTAVHAADALDHALNAMMAGQKLPMVDAAYMAQIGLDERFGAWEEACRTAGAR